LNGELPKKYPPKVAVILIGTNDLGYIEACKQSPTALMEGLPGVISR
jgi:hypothetical protein